MDSDRVLLEKAAKAAGIALIGPVENFIVQFDERHKGGFIVNNDRGGQSAWNPRTSLDDALRLAVKLRLSIDHNDPQDHLLYVSVSSLGCEMLYAPLLAVEEIEDEQQRVDATCRAIVRAAAALVDRNA